VVVGGSLEGRVEVDLAVPRRPEPTAGDSRGAFAAVGHSGRYLGAGQRVDQHQGPADIGVDLVLVQRPSLWIFRSLVISTTTKHDVFLLTSRIRARVGRVHVFNPQGIGNVPSTRLPLSGIRVPCRPEESGAAE
jgi:hypothetical protein